jgi:predicted nucleotidyltransferase
MATTEDEIESVKFLGKLLRERADIYHLPPSDQYKATFRMISSEVKRHFKDEIAEIRVFGSFARNTAIVPDFDMRTDIDVLIAFRDGPKRKMPGHYRRRLSNFAKLAWGKAVVKDKPPTVNVVFYDIHFDLVPAIIEKINFSTDKRILIPGAQNEWLVTDINQLNKRVAHLHRLTVLLKAWNAAAGYPFRSHVLELYLAGMDFPATELTKRFFYAVYHLPVLGLSLTQQRKVDRLRYFTGLLKQAHERPDQAKIELYLNKILPKPY